MFVFKSFKDETPLVFSILGEEWAVAEVQQRVWARTYARAIAGTPINMSFAIESPLRRFELCFAFGTRNAGFGGSYGTTSSSDPAAETARSGYSGDPPFSWFEMASAQ